MNEDRRTTSRLITSLLLSMEGDDYISRMKGFALRVLAGPVLMAATMLLGMMLGYYAVTTCARTS